MPRGACAWRGLRREAARIAVRARGDREALVGQSRAGDPRRGLVGLRAAAGPAAGTAAGAAAASAGVAEADRAAGCEPAQEHVSEVGAVARAAEVVGLRVERDAGAVAAEARVERAEASGAGAVAADGHERCGPGAEIADVHLRDQRQPVGRRREAHAAAVGAQRRLLAVVGDGAAGRAARERRRSPRRDRARTPVLDPVIPNPNWGLSCSNATRVPSRLNESAPGSACIGLASCGTEAQVVVFLARSRT